MNNDEGLVQAKDALAAFADAASDPKWRGEFAHNADAALDQKGISKGAIPDEVLGFLKALSEEELRLVASLGSVMIDSGMYEPSPSQSNVLFWHF